MGPACDVVTLAFRVPPQDPIAELGGHGVAQYKLEAWGRGLFCVIEVWIRKNDYKRK